MCRCKRHDHSSRAESRASACSLRTSACSPRASVCSLRASGWRATTRGIRTRLGVWAAALDSSRVERAVPWFSNQFIKSSVWLIRNLSVVTPHTSAVTMADVFAVQVFFIIFRECLEAVIIISVLLSFLKQCLGQPDQDQKVYNRLRRQVWAGSLSGIALCLVIGGVFIGVFYGLGRNLWAQSEDLWEGVFYLVATFIITIMGLALLRINKTKEKWRLKIAQSLVDNAKHQNVGSKLGALTRRYAMFVLPFITTLREGVEGVVFVGGVSLGLKATAFPIPVVTGILAGLLIGYLIYRGGNVLSIQLFLIASTSVLYLIAAGMFSRGVWQIQFYKFAKKVGGDVAESGSGPGSYDISQSVWHVNCCNPETSNGWSIFNAILGWQNSATYGSVIAYNVYWLFIIFCILCMLYEERTGSLPLKRPLMNACLKVPGLKNYVKRKRAVSEADAAEMVRQGQDHLKTFHQTSSQK